ncbi:MAG: OB-fold nucleic acid binding domain-containing protein, partial [Anaerolineae bacterium]|nr:OB-fold nucleic acid binding domain-containing protein [Anaerolineae bacterium]
NQRGEIVRVVGEVVAIEKISSAQDVLLRDESGAQFVRLWRVVAERAPVEVGMTIDVVGRVRLSRQRRLFIEPALPQDVSVVRLPEKQTS